MPITRKPLAALCLAAALAVPLAGHGVAATMGSVEVRQRSGIANLAPEAWISAGTFGAC